ncbi:hypothetical protein [Defluviimonas sp. SAOS-178_SWC]|uniref:hypothetical protein n=1 Tax=Defluviimonas sp. SAOS-178_SWC TaxID=3121287 RepID=UPI0032220928
MTEIFTTPIRPAKHPPAIGLAASARICRDGLKALVRATGEAMRLLAGAIQDASRMAYIDPFALRRDSRGDGGRRR